MNCAEQWLAILLRANGVVMLLAIPAIWWLRERDKRIGLAPV